MLMLRSKPLLLFLFPNEEKGFMLFGKGIAFFPSSPQATYLGTSTALLVYSACNAMQYSAVYYCKR